MVTEVRSLARRIALVALLALFVVPAAPASAGCRGASLAPGEGSERAVRHATLCLVNRERARRGLRRLETSRTLRRAAERHSADMVRRDYFSHVTPGGADLLDRIRATGLAMASRTFTVGENLAWGAGSTGTPRSIVRMWMNSPGHRANILRRGFRRIGIGIASGAPVAVQGPARTYTTDFSS